MGVARKTSLLPVLLLTFFWSSAVSHWSVCVASDLSSQGAGITANTSSQPDVATPEQDAFPAPAFDTSQTLNVFFRPDSEQPVNDDWKTDIQQFIEYLNSVNDATVVVRGHTALFVDNSGSNVLSEQRAQLVADYIVAAGIADDRVSTEIAEGEQPLADNQTAEGRAQNRRAEVVIRKGAQ